MRAGAAIGNTTGGAATAGSLGVLIIWRTLGGVAAAPFAPVVMGLIQWLFTGEKRSRAIGAWAGDRATRIALDWLASRCPAKSTKGCRIYSPMRSMPKHVCADYSKTLRIPVRSLS